MEAMKESVAAELKQRYQKLSDNKPAEIAEFARTYQGFELAEQATNVPAPWVTVLWPKLLALPKSRQPRASTVLSSNGRASLVPTRQWEALDTLAQPEFDKAASISDWYRQAKAFDKFIDRWQASNLANQALQQRDAQPDKPLLMASATSRAT